MGTLKRSFFATAIGLVVCLGLVAQQSPIQEHSGKIGRAFGEVRQLKLTDPLAALAILEQVAESEPPATDFENENPNIVMASYELCRNLAYLYMETGETADRGGNWEKGLEYFGKVPGILPGPAEKAKAAYKTFAEGSEKNIRQLQEQIEARAEEFKALAAKSEAEYDNDDYTLLEQKLFFEEHLARNQEAFDYYTSCIAKADTDVDFFGKRAAAYEENLTIKLRDQQKTIDTYKGGRGNRTKWAEDTMKAISNNSSYLKNYDEDQRVAFVYRLLFLAPNSKIGPGLLDKLKSQAAAGRAE